MARTLRILLASVVAWPILGIPGIAQQCTGNFVVQENFDAAPSGVSVSTLPNWTSQDGSANYDRDAIVLYDPAWPPSDTPPNCMHLHGYPNQTASATWHIPSPGQIVGLDLSFWYEDQPGASHQVQMSSAAGGPWANITAALQLQQDCNNTFDHHASANLSGFLQSLGVLNDVYIRWSSTSGGVNCTVFRIDTIEATVTHQVDLTYCITSPNSVGSGARIGYRGCTSHVANDLVLTVNFAPGGQFGIFFYGPDQTQTPFGDGWLCVGGGSTGYFRLPPAVLIGPNGYAERYADNLLPPSDAGPGALDPGTTWDFQFWYRDPAAGGAGFNLSDALSVTFTP